MNISMIGQKGMPAHFGGVERHVEALARECALQGHDVVVYARPHYTHTSHTEDGVRVIVLPSINTKHLDSISHTLISTLHAVWHGADVFHYHGVGPSLLSFIPRLLRPRATVVATFHCIDRMHQKWGLFARFMLYIGEWSACTFPHRTIVVSKELKQYCAKKYNRTATYISHGVYEPDLAKSPAKLLKKIGLKEGYILCVSRLIKHKGIHYLIDAYNKVALARKSMPRLVIVGDSVHTDSYTASLRALASGNPAILFTGFMTGDMLKALYAGSTLVVQPSENEGMSLSLLEAMSWSKPVLVSDIRANKEAIEGHGYTFKNKDVDDLALKLKTLLASPKKLLLQGKDAYTFAMKKYSWPSVAKETLSVYKAGSRVVATKRSRVSIGVLGTSRI